MPASASRCLLRRLGVAFAVSFGSLTALLLARYATRQLPQLRARDVPVDTIVEFLLLSVPFTAALTIPMSVFVAVSWVFTRLGADGTLAEARRQPAGLRRLMAPVVAAAAVVGVLTLVSNAQLLPRANQRLAAVLAAGQPAPSDRMMTVGELRAAARRARSDAGPTDAARAAKYEVEIHKKFALAAACVVLALAGVAVVLLFPLGGVGLVLGASFAVFSAYYVMLIGGESLADHLVMPPFVAMWLGNALLLAATLLILALKRGPRAPTGTPSLAVGG